EAVVNPSAPLGPHTQPFVQPAASRRSSVVFNYPDREEVELHLRWPERWKVDARPSGRMVTNVAGGLAAELELKDGEHSLVYKRRLDLPHRELATSQDYEAARSLFGELEKTDAQTIVLVH
ncbi:MAG TPA: DUF3858 domain-containing protein, partial [Thermoanaerobaculia bacterium]|nr:DUF3858 domain-containing protein [Thermoanaerobaculia bacterium]